MQEPVRKTILSVAPLQNYWVKFWRRGPAIWLNEPPNSGDSDTAKVWEPVSYAINMNLNNNMNHNNKSTKVASIYISLQKHWDYNILGIPSSNPKVL